MRLVRILLLGAVLVVAVLGVGRLFVGNLGPGEAPEVAAVSFEPPPGTRMVELDGDTSPSAAAHRLAELLRHHAESARLGVRFRHQGHERLWLVDRERGVLETRSSGSGGQTRVSTLWRGDVEARLAHAAEHGDLEAPGLPPPERRNLYH